MLDFINVTVEDSLRLLKQVKNYPTYVEEQRVFALPAIQSTENGLLVGSQDWTTTIPKDEFSISFHNGKQKPIELMRCVGNIVYASLVQNGDGFVLSRYAVQKCVHDELMQLPLGTVLTGHIWAHSAMGYFVDLGAGVFALLPFSLIATGRTSGTMDRFTPKQEIKCILHNNASDRFTVNTMPLYGTFAENAALFTENNAYIGTVGSTIEGGTFVELTPNFVGLTSSAIPGAKEGDSVAVRINFISQERNKIHLDFLNYADTAAPTHSYLGDVQNKERITHWEYNPCSNKSKVFDYGEEG